MLPATQRGPMFSPRSGFLAKTIMQKLESIARPTSQPTFWLRYADDTFVIIKKHHLDVLHNNSTFPGIEFTYEMAVGGHLPFLDVLVHRNTDESLRNQFIVKKRIQTLPYILKTTTQFLTKGVLSTAS
ncbi:unnamed protein product [Dibothriocephalus latus]|uniref:Reverse transcriptase domain-containing protein n=1 Tax=Dibothriocephalus latus TaxID=60516 RepID=A0A3P6PJ64_DIBLA|nr:unnamed protein product [Dibothriocephalus latus]